MLDGAVDYLTVKSELPTDIAGVQLEVHYNPNQVLLGTPTTASTDADKLQLVFKDNKTGKLEVLLHFKNPTDASQLLHTGAANLLRIPIQAKSNITSGDDQTLKLSQALLSTPSSAAVEVDGMNNNALPVAFTLFQNYPNPFNPTTTIKFSLNGNSPKHATLDIFNILGQRVDRLLDETRSPGTYEIEWDGTSGGGQPVATGIYLYRLQVGSDSDSKKMLLLK